MSPLAMPLAPLIESYGTLGNFPGTISFLPVVLMQVQVQVLALDWRFGFAGAAAVLVQALALDRRFVLRVLLPCWC